jgi:hypothetical protein
MRIFKNKSFAKFAAREGIEDTKLCQAIYDAEAGKIDANYGGGVIKQRIARPNEGKSGGYRAIIFYRQGNHAFFVHGFAKSKKANLNESEVRLYKDAANIVLAYSDQELDRLVTDGVFKEVDCDDQEIQK